MRIPGFESCGGGPINRRGKMVTKASEGLAEAAAASIGFETVSFKNVSFPSAPLSLKRVALSPSDDHEDDHFKIWVEDKETKAQWGVTVVDVTRHGSAALPAVEIFCMLKRSLSDLATGSGVEEGSKASGTGEDVKTSMDGVVNKTDFILSMQLHVTRSWRPVYQFTLTPISLNPTDVFLAKQRDTNEEIGQMRQEMALMRQLISMLVSANERRSFAFLSLDSISACSGGNNVTWNEVAGARMITASHFELSADQRSVTVKVPGVYQVQCRLTASPERAAASMVGPGFTSAARPGFTSGAIGQGGFSFGAAAAVPVPEPSNILDCGASLLLNGSVFSTCLFTQEARQQTMQIFEVMEIAAGSVLALRCSRISSSNPNGSQSAATTRMTIVLLEAEQTPPVE